MSKKNKQKKDDFVYMKFEVSEEEYQDYKSKAASLNMSVNEYATLVIRIQINRDILLENTRKSSELLDEVIKNPTIKNIEAALQQMVGACEAARNILELDHQFEKALNRKK